MNFENRIARGSAADMGSYFRLFLSLPRSPQTSALRCDQTTAEQVRVRRGEGGERPSGVVGQPPVAHLGEPQLPPDDLGAMLAGRQRTRAAAVGESLVVGQRFGSRTAPVEAVVNAGGLGMLAMKIAPVRLVAKGLPFVTMQALRQLGEIGDITCAEVLCV